MRQVERCCFRKSPRKELLFLMIPVGQQDSLTKTTEAAFRVEFSNGEN